MKEIIDRTKNTAEKMVKDRSSYIVVAAVMAWLCYSACSVDYGKKAHRSAGLYNGYL